MYAPTSSARRKTFTRYLLPSTCALFLPNEIQIRALMRHICEEGGESHPTAHASYFASKFIAIKVNTKHHL